MFVYTSSQTCSTNENLIVAKQLSDFPISKIIFLPTATNDDNDFDDDDAGDVGIGITLRRSKSYLHKTNKPNGGKNDNGSTPILGSLISCGKENIRVLKIRNSHLPRLVDCRKEGGESGQLSIIYNIIYNWCTYLFVSLLQLKVFR